MIDADGGRPDRWRRNAEAFDDVAAERIDRLGAKPAHALVGVVAEFSVVRSMQETARSSHAAWLSRLDAAPLGQRRDTPLQRAAIDVAHQFQEAEIELHAGIARDADAGAAALGRVTAAARTGKRPGSPSAEACSRRRRPDFTDCAANRSALASSFAVAISTSVHCSVIFAKTSTLSDASEGARSHRRYSRTCGECSRLQKERVAWNVSHDFLTVMVIMPALRATLIDGAGGLQPTKARSTTKSPDG